MRSFSLLTIVPVLTITEVRAIDKHSARLDDLDRVWIHEYAD